MKALNITAQILLVIGAINWGLVAWFDFNLVTAIFGVGLAADIVYTLVALAGFYGLYLIGVVSRDTALASRHSNVRNTERHTRTTADGSRHEPR